MKNIINNPKLIAKTTLILTIIASVFSMIVTFISFKYEPTMARIGFSIMNIIYTGYISIIYYFWKIKYSKKINLKGLNMFLFISFIITLLLIIFINRIWTTWNLIYLLMPIYLAIVFYCSSKSKTVPTIAFIVYLMAYAFSFYNSIELRHMPSTIIYIISQIHIIPFTIYMWLYGKSKSRKEVK